ncbi:MAG TPA: transglutaminase domain-containing protein, partial [Bacteroidales bacterium]|nr:transglutaminase domain-containing protein [Bacteroidales bacterium]
KSYINDDQAPDGAYYMPHIVVQIAGYSCKGNSTAVISSLDDLYKIVYKRISSINLSESKEIKVLTDSLTAGAESNIDRVGKIFSWVQKNIKYVAFEDGANGYIPREATLVLQRKYGDCKDKTSLLVAMMRSQGLNASFAWVGSREIPYRFTEFPTEFDSNHMIAIWWDDNDNPVVLDGTTLHNRLEDVPSFIQGKECLIERGLADYRVFTIPVASPERNTVYDSLTVELKGDTLTGIGSAYITGEKRPYMIESFDGKEPADLPATINKQMPKASNKFIIESVDPVETESGGQIFKYNYKFYLPDYLSEYNNVSYLNLNLDRFPNNVNIKEDRWTPMELNYTTQHVFVCTFIIPDGYEARDIPKDSSYENSLFSYKQSYTVTGREIKVKTIVTLNFQVIENNEVSQFREMLSQLNSYYNKTIPIYKTVTK